MGQQTAQTLRNHAYLTTRGIFTRSLLDAALATFGSDRILFSADYPYVPNAPSRAFLNGLQIAPADSDKLAYGDADMMLKLV
ncbi:amidohydrolase family protein [Hymenobacter nivis]|uniref:Amidohydrolase-related domain-containing protein n=1 Tax=Hymenobacter nivis TaxID=1850093 RepID=A0A2Z3GE84_9BACT|nr:amidohydrolase family protein [Hymenobacter nivis]AWM31793.1 hypothetical protein DDQ68_02730 [Hymenobacter nivis]